MYNLTTSARDTEDLCIGFDRDRGRRQLQLTNIKNMKGNYDVRNMLRNAFRFAEHQEKGTYGMPCRLTLTKKNLITLF